MLHGPGTKKRGGWRGHPSSLVALVPTQFPAQVVRRCLKCKRSALRSSRFCLWHAKRPRLHLPGRRESATLGALDQLGLVPLDLMALKAWRDLSTVPVAMRAPARLSLVVLWHDRLTRPQDWARAWRNALSLAAYQREGTQQWQVG
jgi:hypothetical protein